MTITIKLFAILRDKAGVAEISLPLLDNATVATAIESLAKLHPTLHPHLARSAAAVNLTRATPDTPLKNGDELALLPPVSGG
jgi:molybdopterin converting factor small subunit